MEVLKIKDWLTVKDNAQFRNIIESPKNTIMIQRIKDDCIFKLGLITFDAPKNIECSVVAEIIKFHSDRIHADIYTLMDNSATTHTIEINDIDMNSDGNRVARINIKNYGNPKN